EAAAFAADKPEEYTERARASMARHVEAMVGFRDAGAEVFDYGNSIRGAAQLGGYPRAFAFPGFVPAYIRPLFCEGKGPFRWAALSGEPADIAATDQAILDLFPDNEPLARWIRMAGERVAFQGLPARICWLGYGERDRAGLRFNELVASGAVTAPIVIGRDHLDCGSGASPYRETEAMADRFAALWRSLAPIGRTPNGYHRLSWTDADLACREWFLDEAADRGLRVQTDGNGNLWGWLGDPADGDAVVTGSHLDSVPGGGGYDGPLGIVSAFLALDLLAKRGRTRRRPIGVVAFTEEE